MAPQDVFDGAEARIIDRGYRRYDGHRTGVRGAMATVVRTSLQRAFGLRRSAWAKALPFATAAFAYVPAIVFIGVVALSPTDEIDEILLPSYGEYYGFVIAAIMVFVSLVAPEVLCTDRRTGMLGVYLASPLDRDTYLASKAAAITTALAVVCLGPPLLLLVANVLQSTGPAELDDIARTTLNTFVAGAALSLLFAGITVGIAGLTDRKAVAAASIMLLFLVSIVVSGTISETGVGEGGMVWSPTLLALEIGARAHGDRSDVMPSVPDLTIWFAWAAWTIGGFAVARDRLRRLPITR